ncbi:MAG TPA: methyltransferase domain-containing protein [Chloroflexota bacterium]
MMTMVSPLRRLLEHPLTGSCDIDDPRTTMLRRRIVREKPFLRSIYEEWYSRLAGAVPDGPGAVLELGSGPGFLREFIPNVITSEVFVTPGVDVVIDGGRLPFREGALRAIVMTDVFHHLSRVREFLSEATRCVRPAGVLAMVEPWVSRWSRLVYTRLHHEPFIPDAGEWEFPPTGPLSGANGALPWIVFGRDVERFRQEFDGWRLRAVEPMMPIRYLLSGGVSLRGLVPDWTYGAWARVEAAAQPWMATLGMFAYVELERV